VLQLDTAEQTAEHSQLGETWGRTRPTSTPLRRPTRCISSDNGERRTTQGLQLDTAEQTAEQNYFELLSQLGETSGRPTRHEFLACRSKIAAVLKIWNC
jgi:hypothetical protein